jgi:hypothetical protein
MAMAVVLAHGSDFAGSVTDSASGKPVPGAIITVGTTVTRADAKGRFQIDGKGPAVNARAYGFGRAQIAATPQNAHTLQLKLAAVTPHAVYLSFWGVGTASVREPVLKLADQGLINAVVIDVKGDMGYISFQTGVPTATEIGAQKTTTVPDIHGLLDRLHKQGIYTIARIVTFKDNLLCMRGLGWLSGVMGRRLRTRKG